MQSIIRTYYYGVVFSYCRASMKDSKTERDGKHWFQMDAGVAAPIGGVVVQRPTECNHVTEYEVLTSLDGKKFRLLLANLGKIGLGQGRRGI